MSGDLKFVLNLWEFAVAPTIEVRTPDWPELTQYAGALRMLYRSAGEVEQLADTLQIAFRAYRYLTSTPLAPGEDVIELDAVVDGCRQFGEGWPQHSGAVPSLALADAAEALRSAPSVFRSELECVASRFELGVLVVPKQHLKIHVKAVLVDLELNGIDVATKEELRKSGICYDLAVVIGDPAVNYASMRVPATEEGGRSGWLFTAPQAPHVAVLLAAGCQNLDTERCWLLGNGSHPTLHLGNERGATVNIPAISHHLTTSRSFAMPVLAPVLTSEATASAQPVFFVSGRWTYYSDETPPEPRVLLSDEDGGIQLHHSRLGDIRPGAIAALRVGHGESEEIARRAADRLKSEGFTDEMLTEAMEASKILKSLLAQRIAEVGTSGVESELRSKGLSVGYAHSLTRSPLRPEYIAPGPKGYNSFVEMLGEPRLADQMPRLIRLRHARRMAGRDIRRELEAQLCADTSWTDDIDADGYACVDTKRLGSMYLEVVARVFDEDQPVAIASLGRLYDPDGSEHVHRGLLC